MQVKRLKLSGELRKIKKRASILGMILSILLMLIYGFFNTLLGLIASVIIIVLMGVLFPELIEKTMVKNLRRQVSMPNMDHAIGKAEFKIDDYSLVRKMNYSLLEFRWDGIIRVSEDEKHYYFFLSRIQPLFIPKKPAGLSHTEQLKLENKIEQTRRRIKLEH
ncbi:YcxB family protein [Jeotgalibacillus sp. ET6]|uniref:YcxB family protein n=1 Tax=Jeotgalibacillus sp. ET6 TaxID=3037260 RepID=UPI0024184B7F|nr:YcxB family protein [Jeotgalibacillus sp. ET6]MDG5472437.1 YcxB family protein [Jeotgalibacillus sp. ET6]